MQLTMSLIKADLIAAEQAIGYYETNAWFADLYASGLRQA